MSKDIKILIQMYDRIINMEHHTSLNRKRMSLLDRAAQFAPFAALTGYEVAVKQAACKEESKWERAEYSELDPSEM